MSDDKKTSLLQLVSRLQVGLSSQSASNVANSERRHSQGRFSRRRQRQNRHTVGVTSEELEDARRLMEEIAFRDNSTKITPLTKQNSEGAVIGKCTFAPKIYAPKSSVKNAIAKPFSSSTSTSLSGASSTVETPNDAAECIDPFEKTSDIKPREKKHAAYRKSFSVENENGEQSELESTNLDYKQIVEIKNAHHAAVQAAASKQQNQQQKSNQTTPTLSPLFNLSSPTVQSPTVKKGCPIVQSESETDEDPSTLKAPIIHQTTYEEQEEIPEDPIVTNVKPESNPVYKSSLLQKSVDESKYNRFNSDKKLKMKRANTIDIPKPINIYDDDDDDDNEIDIDRNARRNTYYALRGPIRVNTPQNNKVPTFELKTDSDRKFMAFINKHNDKNSSKSSIWGQTNSANQGTNWSRKFGNIRTAFEKASEEDKPEPVSSSARSFWQSADDAVTAGRVSTIGPKISRQSARNLQQMFEEKQKQLQVKTPWHEEKNIVTGTLKVDTKGFDANKNYRIVSQNSSLVNNFSHNPMSAFKPISKNSAKDEDLLIPSNVVKAPLNDHKNSEQQLYLYSPKPLLPTSPNDSCDSAPLSPNSAPKTKTHHPESRVLSIAAAKFENPSTTETPVKPRKLSKDRVAIPPVLQHPAQNGTEKITAPYITKGVGSTVRKLSDQYDNLGNVSQAPINNKFVPSYANPITKQTYSNKQKTQPHSNIIQNSNNSAFAPYNPQNNPYQQIQPHHYQPQQPNNYPPAPLSQMQQYNRQQTQYAPSNIYPTKQDIWQQQQQQPIYPEPSVTYSVYPEQPPPQQNYQQQQHFMPHYQQQQKNYPIQQRPYEQSQYQQHHPYNYHQPQDSGHYTTSYQYDKPPNNNYSYQQQNYNYVQPQQNVEHQPNKPITVYNNTYKKSDTNQQIPQKNVASPSSSFKYKEPQRTFNDQHNTKIINAPSQPPKLQTQLSNESVKEYNAVNSRVMTGPVSQQAVTVTQNKPKTRNDHDMEAAFNLKNSLKSLGSQDVQIKKINTSQNNQQQKVSKNAQQKQVKSQPKVNVLQQNASQKMPNFCVNDKPVNLQSLEINERGESVVTSKFHIPVKTIDIPKRTSPAALSKCESWHQIVHDQVSNKPSPRASPKSRTVVRSKSSHTLNLPKQYEAGMSRDEMQVKKKTVEAYFGNMSAPAITNKQSSKSKSSINRIKTSQKLSTTSSSTTTMSTGLSRSRTLPDFACPKLLDESKVDESFEDLFKSTS